MVNDMKVSIVMPTYNGEKYIQETLEAIVKQTYTNWELIVCDDGSTDGTLEIIGRMAEIHPNIKIHKFTHVGNPAILRNKGIRLAEGEYIALCDQDDLWDRQKLELQIKVVKKHNAKFVAGRNAIIDSTGKILAQSSDNKIFQFIEKRGLINEKQPFIPPFYLLLGNFIMNSTMLVKKNLYEELGYLSEAVEHRGIEDYEFILRVIAAGYKIYYLSNQLIGYWRTHSTNLSNEIGSVQKLKTILRDIMNITNASSIREDFDLLLFKQRIAYIKMQIARAQLRENPSISNKLKKQLQTQRFRFYKLLGKVTGKSIY